MQGPMQGTMHCTQPWVQHVVRSATSLPHDLFQTEYLVTSHVEASVLCQCPSPGCLKLQQQAST